MYSVPTTELRSVEGEKLITRQSLEEKSIRREERYINDLWRNVT